MKKKLSLLVAALSLLLLLTGCVEADSASTLTFHDLEGAGTKTIVFAIPKDAPTEIETATDEDGVTTTRHVIYNNSSYFPRGYEAFADWVLAQLPAEDGFRYEIDETDPAYILIRFSYDFTSFEDYAKKTRDLMGEERWEDSSFKDPQLVVTEVKDPNDDNYGKLRVTFVESHYMTSSSVCRLVELGLSAKAAEAGVFAPYGDAYSNPDVAAHFEESGEEDFDEFVDTWYLITPFSACETNGARIYTFGDVTYTEDSGLDGNVSIYVDPAEGDWTVTDVATFLKEGQTGDELYVGDDGLYILTKREGVAEDASWSLENYIKTRVLLGTKHDDPYSPSVGEEGDLTVFRPVENEQVGEFAVKVFFAIVGIVVVVHVAAAVILVVLLTNRQRRAHRSRKD